MKEHLLLDLGLEAEYRIQVLPYKSILSELRVLCTTLSPREKVWVSDKASYAVSEAIPKVGSPTAAHLNPATLPPPAPFQFWCHVALSLKQRLFKPFSRTGFWVRGPVFLDEPFLDEPFRVERLRAFGTHRVMCSSEYGTRDNFRFIYMYVLKVFLAYTRKNT